MSRGPQTVVVVSAVLLMDRCWGTAPKVEVDGGTPPPCADAGSLRDADIEVLASEGFIGFEVAVADVNGDGLHDFLQSNGGNHVPQPITIHLNDNTSELVAHYPSWYSDTFQHYGIFAVGDVFGSGAPEIIAPVVMPRSRDDGGWLDVFFNDGGAMQSTPTSYALARPMAPFAAALGDLNGDARLDVVVVGADVGSLMDNPTDGDVNVFLNLGNRFAAARLLAENVGGVTVRIADVDADGWSDVLVGGKHVTLFRGGLNAFEGAQLPRLGTQLPGDFCAVFGLEVIRLRPTDRGLALLVVDNDRGDICKGKGLWVYPPGDDGGFGDAVHLRNLNNGGRIVTADWSGDGIADVAVTQLGEKEQGDGALFLEGTVAGFIRSTETEPLPLLSLAMGHLDSAMRGIDTVCLDVDAGGVVYLPDRNVVAIEVVRVDGADARFAWVPGTTWVATPHDGGAHRVHIEYRRSQHISVVMSSSDARFGPFVYTSSAAFKRSTEPKKGCNAN